MTKPVSSSLVDTIIEASAMLYLGPLDSTGCDLATVVAGLTADVGLGVDVDDEVVVVWLVVDEVVVVVVGLGDEPELETTTAATNAAAANDVDKTVENLFLGLIGE